ncbi:hypothetical protein BH23BAC1_BH23BAC1_29180 [soil metagenome]
MTKGNATNLKNIKSNTEVERKMYLITFPFQREPLNFNENKGNSDTIKKEKIMVILNKV